MRLWTLHPRYLDAQGLVALWREGLLARAVLDGQTRGYRHHPQLLRFQAQAEPRVAIDRFLRAVHAESIERGYRFDATKLDPARAGGEPRINATDGQLAYEWRHLLGKLQLRSPALFARWQGLRAPEAHPMFEIVEGPVEPWERG
jgi:hypothetical protein